ncbi:MAG: hypothetical protein J6Q78_02880 [Clostridia bacterium]|nr:hypothetical protein [Clostridia bacterium]
MEQSRKNLKNSSIIVLALAGLSLLNILFELFFGELSGELNNATVPEGAPGNVVLIAQIFILVVSVLMLLPQAYIGIKGLKIAKKPNSSIGHIVWGIILVVFTAAGLISPLVSFLQGNGEAFGNVSEFLSIAVDVAVLAGYVKFAMNVRKGI